MFKKSEKWGRKKAGETLEQWPKLADGGMEPPVFLCHSAGVQMTDTIVMNMLCSFGIPTVQLTSDTGDLGEIILGVNAFGSDIYVPQSMYEDAKALLEGENDHEDI